MLSINTDIRPQLFLSVIWNCEVKCAAANIMATNDEIRDFIKTVTQKWINKDWCCFGNCREMEYCIRQKFFMQHKSKNPCFNVSIVLTLKVPADLQNSVMVKFANNNKDN